ncbi:hypothetical protein [Streptomyces sp.]|uniref:hypothetical protein n=1 Tax=Streptomyces sp. TaxID=1931 RepID=UPI002811FADD|nr:hypothetical protein [Streptomyces sp.]
MLPPSAIAGVSVVCALGPWVFTQPMVLRVLAASAAVTAIVGAVVMRHWDTQAGKRVADLTRARASDEWRFEERVAELESDLEESRELRMKLEQRLRAKRSELAALRNEHAALLRRYAAAEADRANVLEDRRMLEIEAAVPARALPAGAPEAASAAGTAQGRPVAPAAQERPAEGAAEAASVPAARSGSGTAAEGGTATGETAASEDAGAAPAAPAVFSPEGSALFLRAGAALARFGADGGGAADKAAATAATADAARTAGSAEASEDTGSAASAGTAGSPEPSEDTGSADDGADPAIAAEADAPVAAKADGAPRGAGTPRGVVPQRDGSPEGARTPGGDGPEPPRERKPEQAQEDEAEGQPGAVDGHGHATASPAPAAAADRPVRQPSGHFTVPTAVAVVPPTAPVRRPVSEDGFDFFGTKKDTGRSAVEAVQNEDLADVVGQEALALHKAETEARFKPADEDARGVGQVIDLTAHDETEQIDVQGLRSAAS